MRKSFKIIMHVIFWIIVTYIHYYDYSTRLGLSFDQNFGMYHIPHFAFVLFFTILPEIIIFYLFYFIFIPILVIRKKIVHFAILSITSSVLVGYIFRLTIGGGTPLGRFVFVSLFSLFWGVIGSAFKGINLWMDSVNQRKSIEKRHLQGKNALLLLQAQINPHFLFNSLNNIDILIEQTPKLASEYLKKLSDILRYALYETKEEITDLSKEISQIENYISLQKIRTDNPKYVLFRIQGEISDQKIAPMIFLPFIENAFKHTKNKTIENAIDIEFIATEKSVRMECKNYFESKQLEIIKNEGLGNEIMKQRLDLLYPGNYKLTIEKTEPWFKVILNINIK